MVCREIMEVIEQTYSRAYAMSWDNVGLLVGRDDKEVQKIYLAVDATDEVIDAAVSCHADMLVTHHPMIFGALKQINNRDFIGKRILRLIQNDISCYAMHTNYDVKGMAELSGEMMGYENAQVLEITCIEETSDGSVSEGIGRIADLKEPVTLKAYCDKVKEVFQLPGVIAFGDMDAQIRRAAICPGSGKSVISAAIEKGADVLVTGDIGHHEGIDAKAQGLAIIDAGHYGIEHIFIEDMKRYLEAHLENVQIIGAPVQHPYVIL
ncbi:Nif3-like dinuclear metal center hexameric protein [Faecalicatena contorta]|uniref:Nif3-like dinuclear metal center hexameric protein n=1 Tax=Faecalicatena contorta TaxID=39482 RepID=UPI001EED6029|nr:Nif3-like dinuclear metal center hexameric protein [Faecalicatena contorta]MCF2681687.1 Nif3-like dinuclear metal center hexameric protein [Faecalicatena contorta]